MTQRELLAMMATTILATSKQGHADAVDKAVMLLGAVDRYLVESVVAKPYDGKRLSSIAEGLHP